MQPGAGAGARARGDGDDDELSAGLGALVELLRGKRVAVLTGAGCSTESGIPDYRGPGTRERARNPVQHHDFVTNARARQRYWARSAVGWPRFCAARPNDAHHALAALERVGVVTGVITQNVDRLHHAAGSNRVIELHGALAHVCCLGCPTREDRASVQTRLLALNPFLTQREAVLAPDGDAELTDELVCEMQVPDCSACGGVLKPDVVFFGGSVPLPTVEAAYALLDASHVLLVVGSSLAVYSGFRFLRRAAERAQPIAIINLGESRGDTLASLRLETRASVALTALARAFADRETSG